MGLSSENKFKTCLLLLYEKKKQNSKYQQTLIEILSEPLSSETQRFHERY